MQDTKVINLSLFTIKFPIAAIASILHRISGVILFLFIPWLLWILQLSLQSAADFAVVQSYFKHACYKWLIWAFASMLIYHLAAGIRHLIMDCGIGESKLAAKVSAFTVIVLSGLAALWLGIYFLW